MNEKIDCRIRLTKDGKLTPGYEALAHLVDATYDPHFRPWYGSILVICSDAEYRQLTDAQMAVLQFADGRVAQVHWMGWRMTPEEPVGGQASPTQHKLLYFVGVSRLEKA